MTSRVRLILMITVFLLLLSSVPPLTAQNTEGLHPGLAIPKVSMALLSEPKVSSNKLTTLEPGELVNILKIQGAWAQIKYKDFTGWARYAMGPNQFMINVSGPTPSPRGVGPGMTYDTESDRMVLFGGIAMGSVWLNDTWTYEVATHTWTKMSPAQSPTKGLGPLAYDKQSDRTIWFYGVNDTYDNPSSETWAYDLNSNSWTKMEKKATPPPLVDPNMAYDAESDRIILFGGAEPYSVVHQGSGIAFRNETWAYDYDANTWTNMQPKLSPPGMNLQAMAYDSAADRIVVLGWSGLEKIVDTWVYDYNTNTWETLGTAAPGPRAFSAMVYDAEIDQFILFGNGDPKVTNDTWSFDLSAGIWTELTPQSPPEGRFNHAMAYSPTADRIVLFGGNDGQEDRLDTWLYDAKVNTWTVVGP